MRRQKKGSKIRKEESLISMQTEKNHCWTMVWNYNIFEIYNINLEFLMSNHPLTKLVSLMSLFTQAT